LEKQKKYENKKAIEINTISYTTYNFKILKNKTILNILTTYA